jgi:predicted  nucleic acid-binding Zn ribbon protein
LCVELSLKTQPLYAAIANKVEITKDGIKCFQEYRLCIDIVINEQNLKAAKTKECFVEDAQVYSYGWLSRMRDREEREDKESYSKLYI